MFRIAATLKNSLPVWCLIWGLGGYLFACTIEQSPPSHLLSEEKMADILADIHVAEARVTQMQLRSLDSSVLVYEHLQEQIWKKHNVDTTLYRESYTYYTSHPAFLTTIYDKVEKKLEEREKNRSIKL